METKMMLKNISYNTKIKSQRELRGQVRVGRAEKKKKKKKKKISIHA